ncbi:hypothetical protein K3495_g5259 [Podosphaera aphanis]|nr:hypothetical protein K3495_g5259 [Podosphaera aphanis]
MPDELRLFSRRNLGSRLAARSAHGDFAAYQRGFKHEEATSLCECGEEKSPEYPFVCSRLRNKRKPRPRTSRGHEGDIWWVLASTDEAQAFGDWYKII